MIEGWSKMGSRGVTTRMARLFYLFILLFVEGVKGRTAERKEREDKSQLGKKATALQPVSTSGRSDEGS
jgi:hypothetical protein